MKLVNEVEGFFYTMDLGVVPWSCRICDWVLTRPRVGSVYTKSDRGVRGLEKACFKTYIIHPHGPMGVAVGEAKEVLGEKLL